jgi:hypothetical protein
MIDSNAHKQARETMSPAPRETRAITDEEETDGSSNVDEYDTDSGTDKRPGRMAWQERLRKGVRHMTRMGPRGNQLPEVGAHCIIIVGNTRQDVGQLAQVTEQKAQMVQVQYRGAKNRRLESKLKRPSSLIMLEKGLTMKQDRYGTVWICSEE